jgi:LmbE family N-acetylglucosaminyl deacetylase
MTDAKQKTVLVVAAHPDDELLGPGGTLIKHVAAGDAVHCLILGEGMMAREHVTITERDALHEHARRAGEMIGFHSMEFGQFPDNAFDTVGLLSIAKTVEERFSTVRPDVVYTHHEYDLNVDHRLAFQAVLTASRPCNADRPRELYAFETLSSTEWQSKDCKQFRPNCYVDIAATLEKKLQALSVYASEMRPYPHARSAEGVRILAQYRGLESHLPAAEAFMLIRKYDGGY